MTKSGTQRKTSLVLRRAVPQAVSCGTQEFHQRSHLDGNACTYLLIFSTRKTRKLFSIRVSLCHRKQLAFYEERKTQPRRLNDSARLSLVLWSRLFDWKNALVIVKPETLI